MKWVQQPFEILKLNLDYIQSSKKKIASTSIIAPIIIIIVSKSFM